MSSRPGGHSFFSRAIGVLILAVAGGAVVLLLRPAGWKPLMAGRLAADSRADSQLDAVPEQRSDAPIDAQSMRETAALDTIADVESAPPLDARYGFVTGWLVAPDGALAAGRTVRLVDDAGRVGAEDRSSASGRFRLRSSAFGSLFTLRVTGDADGLAVDRIQPKPGLLDLGELLLLRKLRLEGRIIDERGAPLAGITVALNHGRGPAKSGSEGEFVLDVDHAGRCDVSIRTPGFRVLEPKYIMLEPGETMAQRVTFLVTRGPVLRGRVLDERGSACAAAWVSGSPIDATDGSLRSHTTSDESGAFDLTVANASIQVLDISKAGYETVTQLANPALAASLEIRLTAPRCVDAEVPGMADERLRFSICRLRDQDATVVSESPLADGVVATAPESWRLPLSDSGWLEVRARAPGRSSGRSESFLVPEHGPFHASVTVRWISAAELRFHVWMAGTRDPVPGARVELREAGKPSDSRDEFVTALQRSILPEPLAAEAVALADEDGIATIRDVQRGRYVASVDSARDGRATVDPIEVKDANTFVCDVELAAVGRIRGIVRDSRGDPLTGIRLVAVDSSGRITRGATRSDGSYVFGNVLAGRYRVDPWPVAGVLSIVLEDAGYTIDESANVGWINRGGGSIAATPGSSQVGFPIELTAGGEAVRDLVIDRGATGAIEGDVRFEGASVAGARVQASPARRSPLTAVCRSPQGTADATGHLRIARVPVGTYELETSLSGHVWRERSLVEVAADATTHVVIEAPSTTITGRVLDATTHAPIEGAIVSAFPADRDEWRRDTRARAIVDSTGAYCCGPLLAGSLRIWVFAPSYREGSLTIDCQPGRHSADFELEHGGWLRLTLHATRGASLPTELRYQIESPNGSYFGGTVKLSSDGVAWFPNENAEERVLKLWRLEAAEGDAPSIEKTVTGSETDNTDLDLDWQ